MNDNKAMLGTAPIGKLLFKLALPTVVADIIAVTFTAILFAVQFKKSLKKLEKETV